MSQIKFRADLNEAEFPLLYQWAGRTVMSPQGDGKNPAPITTPQILFCKDVLPTQQGLKSISYKDLVAAASPANLNFSQEFTVSDAAQNKALIGITLDSHIYMLTNALPTWVDVTPGGWAGGDNVTMGVANGTTYLYLQNKGCYLVNITGVVLTLTALSGITAANILGMSSAVNYLLLWDATGTVYWSSTVNPLDFVPSLITGAGSTIPYDLAGKIIIIVPLNNGFVIYSSQNIVLSSFSNNTQFPWIFRNANNGSGVISYKQVSLGHDLGYHVALTFAGVLQITPQGCTSIVPEVADFLAARIYEDYDTVSNTFISTNLDLNLYSRITVLAARWVCLSYGITGATGTPQIYSDCLVYDTILQRWGKLHIDHTCIFEIETNMESVIGAYNQASELGQTYASASPQTYASSAVNISQPPLIGRVFGILQASGVVKIAIFDYNSYNDNAVVVLGKYQLIRNNLMELNEITVECIPVSNTGFSLAVISSINGRDNSVLTTPVLLEDGSNIQRYGCRVVGKNHLIVCKGSFDLTSIEITAVMGSRR